MIDMCKLMRLSDVIFQKELFQKKRREIEKKHLLFGIDFGVKKDRLITQARLTR